MLNQTNTEFEKPNFERLISNESGSTFPFQRWWRLSFLVLPILIILLSLL